MKIFCPIVLLVAVSAFPVIAQEAAPLPIPGDSASPAAPAESGGVDLRTARGQASYAIGLNLARSLQRDGLDIQAVLAGIRDIVSSAEPKLNEAQCQEAMTQFAREVQARRQAEMQAVAEKNKRDGAAFLAANKNQEGVKTLPSGLQYQVIKSGTGAQPTLQDTVTTHYHGMLIDGTVFDSSVARGEPATIQVGGVIRGWREALQMMHVGDKWRLFIPSELAYGPDGAGEDIGPNSVLVFDIELLNIE